MDIGPVLIWVAALSALLSFATTIWNMLNAGAKKNAARLDELFDKVSEISDSFQSKTAEMDRHLQRHDDRLSVMPSIEMMHRLEMAIGRLEGDLGKIDERLKPVASIAERMQELLLAQSQR